MRNLYLHLVLQLRAFRVGVIAGLLLGLCLAGRAQFASAAALHYAFEGKVSAALSAPFGFPVTNLANVTGDFWYDSSLIGTVGSTPATMRYDHPYSLNLTFAPGTPNALTAAVNGYRIEITNNSVQPGGTFDLVSILYSSTVLPLSSLSVNGSPQTSGLIRVNLLMPSSTLATPILPSDLSAVIIPQPTNFFADTPTGGIDALFSVTKLVPEPGSNVLIALGAVALFAARKRISSIKRKV